MATRRDSRDAPYLFGLGLKEMLADEITAQTRWLQAEAIEQAARQGHPVKIEPNYQGINYGSITASRDGSVETSKLSRVEPDLRVRPFFAHGALFRFANSSSVRSTTKWGGKQWIQRSSRLGQPGTTASHAQV